jgi:beta-lactamase class A
MIMKRRNFFGVAALAASGFGTSACSGSIGSELPEGTRSFNEALTRLRSLPGFCAYTLAIQSPKNESLLRIDHLSDRPLVIGSAFKTFIVTKCLQDVEEGRLSLTQLIAIDDRIRVDASKVFINLTGSVRFKSVLDAILGDSDNTAADAAMMKVGADRVRAFIASAGLQSTRIPDSLRIFQSYASGAPLDVDIGWEGIQKVLQGDFPGTPRPILNNQVSIISTGSELVSYYQRVMHGEFFNRPATLTEFKRLHAMGNSLAGALPETAIYAKSGNASWLDYNLFTFAGQMILANGNTVTFAFVINWNGPDTGVAAVFTEFKGAIVDAFVALKLMYGSASATACA